MTPQDAAVRVEDHVSDERPALSPGVELIGEYEGSGFKDPPSLVRRPDGQILQFPPLLFELLRALDGQRDLEEIAAVVSDRVQRRLEPDDIRFLLDEKLRPQAIVAATDGTSPRLERQDPFLAFRYRLGVISEGTSGRFGAAFRPLFLPPVLLLVTAGLVLADWWLFFDRGVAQALRQTLYHPGLFLPLLAAVVVCAAFHEIGHATACRYGGARPGQMGCGLYLAWPAFYTDVSDAYRLNRRGRLRTDLGGVYFNVVIIVVATGVYLISHSLEVLVLVVVIEHLEIAHQLLPVIRLDGYYVVSDLTGVPDLFARIGPVLRGLLFWKPPDPSVTALKGWVRAAVRAWVLVVVPLLVLELLMVLIHLPRILATAWDSASRLGGETGRAFGHGRPLDGASDAAQIAVLAIPITGLLLMIVQLFRKVAVWSWRTTRKRPIHRGAALLTMGAAVTVLALSWIPAHHYQPIGPGERGTEGEGFHALFSLVGGPGPLYSQQVALQHTTHTPDHSPAQPTNRPPAPLSPTSPAPSRTGPPPAPAGSPGSTVPPTHAPASVAPAVTVPKVTLPPVTVPGPLPVTIPPVTVPRTLPVTIPPATVPRTLPVTIPALTVPSTLPRPGLPTVKAPSGSTVP
jgi:putative peptide zinc metalloprotease protein